ncbi:MAG TPA: hypothetical protein VGM41_12030 [Chitinophagaceae bacterium]
MNIKLRDVLISLIILVSLLPAWYFNRYLQRIIQPRRSFGRFLLYLLSGFAMAFGYTFIIVWIISRLFPLPKQ